jgi:hypothetical protein
METRTIELTKEEAQLLPLLYKVRIQDMTVEAAPQAMRFKLLVDGLVKKAQGAFLVKEEVAEE